MHLIRYVCTAYSIFVNKYYENSHLKSLIFYEQEVKKRSKTVMLVKNLPANTTIPEIRELFAKYGELGRVLLPPNGITGESNDLA